MSARAETRSEALRLAEGGFAVFPFRDRSDAADRQHAATSDWQVVETSFDLAPDDTRLAVRTRGLIVVVARRESRWLTSGVRSALAGAHPIHLSNDRMTFWYRAGDGRGPRSTNGYLAPDVDTRSAEGRYGAPGYIVLGPEAASRLPGSVDELPDAPAWLTGLIEKAFGRPEGGAA
ncbi:MAG: bifunctional DNA primase/polymerase [Planctomycetota bacterium]